MSWLGNNSNKFQMMNEWMNDLFILDNNLLPVSKFLVKSFKFKLLFNDLKIWLSL